MTAYNRETDWQEFRAMARQHYREELSDMIPAALQVTGEIVAEEGYRFVPVFMEMMSWLPFEEFLCSYDPEAYTEDSGPSGQQALSRFKATGLKTNTDYWQDVLADMRGEILG